MPDELDFTRVPKFSRCAIINCPYKQTTDVDVETLRCQKHIAIEAWWDQIQATGFATGSGWNVKVGWEDQYTLASYMVLLINAVDAEVKTLSDLAVIRDTQGGVHQITIQAYKALMLDYGDFCETKYITYCTLLGQLQAATTTQELNAIEIP